LTSNLLGYFICLAVLDPNEIAIQSANFEIEHNKQNSFRGSVKMSQFRCGVGLMIPFVTSFSKTRVNKTRAIFITLTLFSSLIRMKINGIHDDKQQLIESASRQERPEELEKVEINLNMEPEMIKSRSESLTFNRETGEMYSNGVMDEEIRGRHVLKFPKP
jgi:hypothetical protein